MSSSSSFAAAHPRVSAGACIVAGARRAAAVSRPPRAAPVGTSGRGGEEEERNLAATTGVRRWWRRRGAPALTRAARGYESASTSTSTSKSTDDADRAKPPPKKDYRRNRRPKAGGAAAKPRYNRPPLHDPSSSADAGADEDQDSHARRPPSMRDRPKWLSHQHTRTPGQQPQQRREKIEKIGFPHRGPNNDDKTKMNANEHRRHGGMRPGERIVKAMEALPRASVAGIASAEGEDVVRALRSPETYGRAYPAANVDAYEESTNPSTNPSRDTAGKNRAGDKNAAAGLSADDDDAFGHVPAADDRDSVEDSVKDESSSPGVGYRSVDEAVTKPNGVAVRFSAPTLNFAIKELGERGNFERAHALYLWMGMQKDERYVPNRYTLVALFGAASERGHAKIVTKVWRQRLLFDPDVINSEVASAAITALGRCENWPAAYQVWKDLASIGEPRNMFVYTAILTVLRESQRWEEAGDVFRAMRDEPGVVPDAITAGLTLAAFDGARRWREANALAKRLVDVYKVAADERLCHQVIVIAGRAEDMAHARAQFNRMLASPGLVVTTYSYNCLLGGYARNGDWDGASEVARELKAAHLNADSYTYTHLVSAAERAGRYAEADAVWSEMLKSPNPSIRRPSTVMCGAYVHCLGCQGRWLEAREIVNDMRHRWNVNRNAAVYNALLGALVRADEVETALEVFDEMQTEDGVLPTEISFMLLVRACQECGMVNKARELSNVRDSLAEAGALENDFSKYDSHSGGANAQEVGRLAAGLPPV